MLPTNSHTWFTVHELISSVCAWHLLWALLLQLLLWFIIGPGDDDALLCVRDGCCWIVVVVAVAVAVAAAWKWCCSNAAADTDADGSGGEPTKLRRPGLGDSIFKRLLIGVDALKSNGDEALARNWLFKFGWSFVVRFVGNGARASGDFCIYDRFVNVDWPLVALPTLLPIRFGDCCRNWLWLWWWLADGELCNGTMALDRLTGPFRICCSSASLAARA